MVVYVEYVFIDNFVIDLLLFKTAFKITGKTVSKTRLFFCSFLGGIIALVYPLITENAVIISAVKILFGLLLTFCAAKFRSVKDYVSFTAIFLGLTFAVGGAIIGLFSLFGLNYSSEVSIALMFLPVLIILHGVNRIIRYLYRKKDVAGLTAYAEIRVGSATVKVKGFFDTGNALYDGLSPVILVNKAALKPILGLSVIKRAKYITVKTVGCENRKTAFKPDELVIYYGDERNIFKNVTVCVEGDLGCYDAILHPALMERVNEREFAFKTEKVS